MNKPSPLSPERCTILGATARLCGRERLKDCPYAVCAEHAHALYRFMLEAYPQNDPTTAELRLATLTEGARRHREVNASRSEFFAAQSQVYYLRIGDHVKIGYTGNMKQRLSQLRLDSVALLATEPGGSDLESKRHKQFAAERIGRREDFQPSRRLLDHITSIRDEHGEPVMTTWPNSQNQNLLHPLTH